MQTKTQCKIWQRKTITKVEVYMSVGVYIMKETHIEKNLKFQKEWPLTATLIEGKIFTIMVIYMRKEAYITNKLKF